MAKAVFFDLDGTLTDSGEGIINCVSYTLEEFGLPVPHRDALRVFVGPPLRESFVKFGVPKEEVDNAIKIYRSRYIPIGKFENSPYEGIRELLERLKAEGHKLYVATSKPETTSVEILEHFDLAKYFDIICGASFDHARHSKALVIAYLLEQTGEGLDAVMVGDTAFDVTGAAVHGISTIGVSWGYGSTQEMREAGAIAIASTTAELLNLILEAFRQNDQAY
jgi:phosphoglycolate phosphatase